jgi:hypothetical protein
MINRVYDALGRRGEIVEAACNVWRQGFREMEPGPFVMPPDMAAQFFIKADVQTPRLAFVISTACSLINSHKWVGNVDGVLETLLSWIARLLQTFAGRLW